MRYIIGIGTGRSGTASLAKLLNAQPGAQVGHEQAPVIPWGGESDRAVRWLEGQSAPIMGDVAHAWLSLMPQLVAHYSVRCVALWRPAEPTVESFCEHMPAAYIQSDRRLGAKQFPTYDLPERKAWRRYVEAYHQQLRALSAEGFVGTFPMNTLNRKGGQCRILSAAGFEREHHVYVYDCHENVRK